jgi:3-phosphoshikimate 1-carboxyvinyltransferase
MAFAILSLAAEGETTIKDAECVSKSYPHFWMDFQRVGIKVRRNKE